MWTARGRCVAMSTTDNQSIPFLQTFRSVVLTNGQGKAFNITSLVTELSIYSDIFSNVLTGEVLVGDGLGGIDQMGIKGRERLTVELFRGDKVHIEEFFVYSITDRIAINNTSEVYKIHFASVEAVLNENTRVYQALTGTNSQSVKTIFDSYIGSKKSLTIEPTVGNFKSVMPSWTPFQAINWYCGRSTSQESKGNYFLFYENHEGFHFKAIETMVKQDAIVTLRHEPTQGHAHVKDPFNIREYEVIQNTDTLKGFQENNTTLWTNDLVRKKIVKKRFESNEDPNGFELDMKSRRDVYGSMVMIRPETKHRHTQTQTYQYDAIQNKMYQMRNLFDTRMKALLLGDGRIDAGQVVEVRMNQRRVNTKDDKREDQSISGRHLITGVRQIYKPQDFHLSIETVKIKD